MADGIFAILRMWNMKIPSYSPYQYRFVLVSAPVSRAFHQAVESFAPALKRWAIVVQSKITRSMCE